MHSELRFYEGIRDSGIVASITYGKSGLFSILVRRSTR